MTDCGGCAACWRCRREMRALEAPIEVSAEVKAKAAEVMARLDAPPPPKVRTPSSAPSSRAKAVGLRTPRKRTPVKRKPLPDDKPVACVQCGGMRGLVKVTHNSPRLVLAGKDGLCEVCLDKPVLEALLAQHEAGQVQLTYERLGRARRYIQRVLKDGRAFHPEASHGAGYTGYGCRCAECTAARTEYMRGHRQRTEEVEKTQP